MISTKRRNSFGLPTPVIILADKSQETLAKSVVDVCNRWQDKASRQFHDQDSRRIEYKDVINWKCFRDGFPDLFIKDVKDLAGKDVIFVASFHSVDVIFAQISLLYQLPRYLVHSCTVILPYFPTGTMERIDNEGQIATAKTLATILSEIPSTARGPTQIMIFELHALQERFYFKDTVIPRLESAITLLIRTVEANFKGSNHIICFPDDGAEKRFARQFPNDWPKVTFTKKRNGDKRFLELKEADAAELLPESHVIIIDDLVQTGGTLLEAAKALRRYGASSVNAFVTHAVFPEESWRKFIEQGPNEKAVFGSFWITDSIPHASLIAKHPPFKLLSLAPLIADILLGFDLKLFA